MGALPQHVPADPDPRQRHRAVGVGRVDDFELEAVGRQIFESALEVERLERSVRVLARPDLGRDALPVSEHCSFDLRDVCFHIACLRLIAGRLRRGSAKACRDKQEQQRCFDGLVHAQAPATTQRLLHA